MKSTLLGMVSFGLIIQNSLAQLAIYQFTGSSSGNNQFNEVTAQPANATFDPFVRVNVSWASGADVFNSKSWTQGASLDSTEYVGYTVRADSGFSLDLTGVSFGSQKSSTGPASGQVSLFLDNSSTATASASFSPGTTLSTTTFDFPDVSASQAEFRFYGFGATSASGTLRLDNVATSGSITPVPEPRQYSFMAGLVMLSYAVWRRWKSPRPSPGPDRE